MDGSPETKARLHLLLSADAGAVDDCLAVLQAGDAVLLADRGVRLVLRPEAMGRLCSAAGKVLAATADLEARGLSAPEAIVAIDDDGWARLVRDHAASLSWT